jgi:hypothetical protein
VFHSASQSARADSCRSQFFFCSVPVLVRWQNSRFVRAFLSAGNFSAPGSIPAWHLSLVASARRRVSLPLRFSPLAKILPPGFHPLMIFIVTFRSRIDFQFSSSNSYLPVRRVRLPRAEFFISPFSISSHRQVFHVSVRVPTQGLSLKPADFPLCAQIPVATWSGRSQIRLQPPLELSRGLRQVLRFHRFSISRANSPAAGARQVRAYDFILALLIFGSLAGSWFYRIPLGPCVFASGARLVATGLFAAADPHTFSCCTDLAVGCYSSCSLVAACPSSHQLSLLLSIFVAS